MDAFLRSFCAQQKDLLDYQPLYLLSPLEEDEREISDYFYGLNFPGYEKPTFENVAQLAFRHLEQARNDSGDICLIYFSGHGSITSDVPKGFRDSQLETLVCMNSRTTARDLRDKEIAFLLYRTLRNKPKVHCLVITDCCHGGGVTRGDATRFRSVDNQDKGAELHEFLGFGHGFYKEADSHLIFTYADFVHLAASTAYQKAVDTFEGGSYSLEMVNLLRNGGSTYSYRQLSRSISATLEVSLHKQSPVSLALEDGKLDRRFLGEDLVPYAPSFELRYNQDRARWQLNAGSIHGLVPSGRNKKTKIRVEGTDIKAELVAVELARSVVKGDGLTLLDRSSNSYRATLVELGIQPMTLDISALSDGMKAGLTMAYERGRHIYVKPVNEPEVSCDFEAVANESGFSLKGMPYLPPQKLAGDFLHDVDRVARWNYFRKLEGCGPRFRAGDFDFIVERIEGQRTVDSASLASVRGEVMAISPTSVLKLSYRKNLRPAFRFHISLRESAKQSECYIAALYFGSEFGIFSNYIVTGARLSGQSRSIALNYEPKDSRIHAIPLDFHRAFVENNIESVDGHLKILVSDKPIDLGFIGQPSLLLGGEAMRSGKESSGGEQDQWKDGESFTVFDFPVCLNCLDEDNGKSANTGKTKIIAIGINNYRDGMYWPNLKFPVSDCEKLLEVLQGRYSTGGYRVQKIYDEKAIADSVYTELHILTENRELETIEEEDTVIIVFAGHGFVSSVGTGCWVCWDAGDPKNPTTPKKHMIKPGEVAEILENVKARHVLLIIDACYGDKFSDMVIPLPTAFAPQGKEIDNPTRWIITSGRKGLVPDNSLFMKSFINVLEKNEKPSVNLRKLVVEVEEELQNLGVDTIFSPHAENLVPPIFKGGDFYFHLAKEASISKEKALVFSGLDELLSRLRVGSRNYRELLHQGRFRYVRIEDVLMANTNFTPLTEVSIEVDKESKSLTQALEYLWNRADRSALILGDGGMGKTMSLLRIWEKLLDGQDTPVPIFVALNEYNLAKGEERSDFIARYIVQHYLRINQVTNELLDNVWNFFKSERPKDSLPSIMILLDGLNEVTADRTNLNAELLRLSKEATDVQLVVTSRFGAVENLAWAQGFQQMKLLPLDYKVISQYLSKNNRDLPEEGEIYGLLTNPMMLTIYTQTEQQSQEYGDDTRFDFKYPVNREAELLWNFREAQLVKLHENTGTEPSPEILEERNFQIFLMKYVVPYIAWLMEKSGQFYITDRIRSGAGFDFGGLVSEAFHTLKEKGLSTDFDAFWKYLKDDIGLDSISDAVWKTRKIRKYLVEYLYILVPEGDELRFLHQNFRDFYASCHLLNCIDVSLSLGCDPKEWDDNLLTPAVQKNIGDLDGQYLFNTDSEYLNYTPIQSKLVKLINYCKKKPYLSRIILNIVRICHLSRESIGGMDLSDVTLVGIDFRFLNVSDRLNNKYYTPKLFNTLVHGRQFVDSVSTSLSKREKLGVPCHTFDNYITLVNDLGIVSIWSIGFKKCLNLFRVQQTSSNSFHISSALTDFSDRKSRFSDDLMFQSNSFEQIKIAARRDGNTQIICFSTKVYEICTKRKIVLRCLDFNISDIIPKGRLYTYYKGAVKSVQFNFSGDKVFMIVDFSLHSHINWDDLPYMLQKGYTSSFQIFVEYSFLHSEHHVAQSPLNPKILYQNNRVNIVSRIKNVVSNVYSEKQGYSKKYIKYNISSGDAHFIHRVAISQKGDKILLVLKDLVILEIDTQSGDILKKINASNKFEGYLNMIDEVVYCPIGERVLFKFRNDKMQEWDLVNFTKNISFRGKIVGERAISYSLDGNEVNVFYKNGEIQTWSSLTGKLLIKHDISRYLKIQGLDLRNLHPDSVFTDEEKERMRRYGAIFNDQDKADWDAAVEDAYGEAEK